MNPEQVLLGLSFLLLSSEEFISPKEDLLGKRKHELRVNFLKHIPKLFEILTGKIKSVVLAFFCIYYLGNYIYSRKYLIFKKISLSSLFYMSYLLFLEILKNAPKTSNSDEVFEALKKVFSDMFTWLPFEKHLTPDLLRVLMPLGENEVSLK